MMNLRACLSACLVAATGLAPFVSAQAGVGEDTATLLNLMYNDTRQDCGPPDQPAFLCSGVLFRGTTPSTAYQFYSISPANQARGGVSASYLRKDAKYRRLAYNYKSGFIFDSVATNPADHADYKVLCSFPIDAASADRTKAGCGDSSRTAAVEDYCANLGITTAEQWLPLYRNSSLRHSAQCSFDVRAGGANTADAFYQSLRAMKLIATESFEENNELILEPWQIDPARSPSILASFYLDDSGVEGARLNQIQWFNASARFLPVVRMQLPATASQDAYFGYAASAQAIQPGTGPDGCRQWLEKSYWLWSYDASLGKNVNSLVITPTACGRATLAEQTDNFFNHLVSRFYLDSHWSLSTGLSQAQIRDSVVSMRRQLVCHLASRRSQQTWTLEPARPYTTHDKSVAAGCNNSVAG